MGLDTRAYMPATEEWRAAWVESTNEAGERPRFWGLMVEKLTEPVTVQDAPSYHQDRLDELPWPGGLCGGMLSGDGGSPSFRGKVYADYVEAASGVSLYAICEPMLEGEALARTALRLREAVDDPPALNPNESWVPTREERHALACWFEVAARYELAVGGDY